MGKKSGGGSAPAAPDPKETAAAQTQTNKDTAYWNAVLNNVNQITPYGTLTYKQTGGGKTYNEDAYNAAQNAYNTQLTQYNSWQNPGTKGVVNPYSMPTAVKREDFLIGDTPPSFTSTIELTPEQQAIYDTMTAQDKQLLDLGGKQIGRIEEAVAAPYSYDGIGNEINQADVLQAQKNAEEAIMSRLNPQFGRDEESIRTRLINQGISQGSEAYNREMEGFGQTKNDARVQALLAANQYGGDLQNQALQRRNQAIQEYTAQRTAPLNEYIGFTSGTQVQTPQFQSTGYAGAAPADYAGLVNNKYQSDLANYNANVAGRNSTMSGLFGLGGSILQGAGAAGGFGNLFGLGSAGASSMGGSLALAAASDIRLKTNIKPVGTENGHKVYEFEYIGSPERYIGAMAHEVEQINPDAVVTMDNGFKAVKYDMIGVDFREAV
jgi:hypothetical protein